MTSRVITLAIIMLFCFAACTTAQQATCTALIFDTGSDEGAYQAGVFQGLVNNLPASEVAYNVISGIGVGAINAAFIGQYAIGQETQAAADLVSLWSGVTKDDVYTNWLGGVLQGLLFEPAIYNSAPLQQTLAAYITDPIVRQVSVGAVDVNSQEYVSFDTQSLSNSDLITVLMASSAKPMIFPYVAYGNSTFLDGSVINAFDLATPLANCLEITGGNQSAITIDMVFTQAITLNSWAPGGDFKAVNDYLRASKISDLANSMRQYTEAKGVYTAINWRYIVVPSTPLPDSDFPFLFSYDQIQAMLVQGNADAQTAIATQTGLADRVERVGIEKQLRKHGLPVTDDMVEKFKEAIKKQHAKMQEYKH